MKTMIAAVALLIVGCSGQTTGTVCGNLEASECAIREFRAGLHSSSSGNIGNCEAVMQATIVQTVSSEEVTSKCGLGFAVSGCMLDYTSEGATILLADTEHGQSNDTLAHEMLHVLLECTSSGPSYKGDSDAGHKGTAWKNLNP